MLFGIAFVGFLMRYPLARVFDQADSFGNGCEGENTATMNGGAPNSKAPSSLRNGLHSENLYNSNPPDCSSASPESAQLYKTRAVW